MAAYDTIPPVEYHPEVSRAEYSVWEHAREHAEILSAYGLTVTMSFEQRTAPVEHVVYLVEVKRP